MASELSAMTFEAPTWGWISLAASAQGLRMLGLPKRTEQAALDYLQQQYRDAELTPGAPFLLDVAAQVQAYLAGELEQFAVTLDLRGHTSFELAVWAAVARIPFGQTRTYSWVADQVGAAAARHRLPARRWAIIRCRSSCRATASSAPTAACTASRVGWR